MLTVAPGAPRTSVCRAPAYLDAERRRHPVSELTLRQWQPMNMLAAGHTNAQIARRLGISEGTVRKHLENIYRRLQVSSRAAAITRAFSYQATDSLWAAPSPGILSPPDGSVPGRPRGHPPAAGR
jgi:DNA-binding CsgD family transcriptional regulator